MTDRKTLRRQILDLVRDYQNAGSHSPFRPGEDPVRYAGRYYDADELVALVDSSLDFWLTAGRYAEQFEAGLAEFLGLENALLVNSGSSANLVAFSTLTSPRLKDRRVRPGDEVITVAAGFPTTVNPIIQAGAIPVFVDVDLGTYVPSLNSIEAALSPKTRAVMIAHTMGVPYAVREVREFCDRHHLWLVEDNCDALGSRYAGKLTATFGDLATFSFYPAHHITMGEGGAVATGNEELARIARSFRDWGTRLLLLRRRKQHLRQTLRPAVRDPPPSATTTNTSTRTSATTSRSPICRPPSVWPSSASSTCSWPPENATTPPWPPD